MTIDDPCTHPAEWACKPSLNDPTRCVGQAKWEAWIVAEEKMAKARADGKKLYINTDESPNIVGNVDMTATDRKQPLAPTGKSEDIPLPSDFNDVPDVDERALDEWRQRKRR